MDICEFVASLVYRLPVQDRQRNPILKEKKERKEGRITWEPLAMPVGSYHDRFILVGDPPSGSYHDRLIIVGDPPLSGWHHSLGLV